MKYNKNIIIKIFIAACIFFAPASYIYAGNNNTVEYFVLINNKTYGPMQSWEVTKLDGYNPETTMAAPADANAQWKYVKDMPEIIESIQPAGAEVKDYSAYGQVQEQNEYTEKNVHPAQKKWISLKYCILLTLLFVCMVIAYIFLPDGFFLFFIRISPLKKKIGFNFLSSIFGEESAVMIHRAGGIIVMIGLIIMLWYSYFK